MLTSLVYGIVSRLLLWAMLSSSRRLPKLAGLIAAQRSPCELLVGTMTGAAPAAVITLGDRVPQQMVLDDYFSRSLRRRLA